MHREIKEVPNCTEIDTFTNISFEKVISTPNS